MTTFEVSYLQGFLRISYSRRGVLLADAYQALDVEDPMSCVSWGVSWISERGVTSETAFQAVKAALETPGDIVTVGSGLPLAIAV